MSVSDAPTPAPVASTETPVTQADATAAADVSVDTGGEATAPAAVPSPSAVDAQVIEQLQAKIAELEGRIVPPEPAKPPERPAGHELTYVEQAALEALGDDADPRDRADFSQALDQKIAWQREVHRLRHSPKQEDRAGVQDALRNERAFDQKMRRIRRDVEAERRERAVESDTQPSQSSNDAPPQTTADLVESIKAVTPEDFSAWSKGQWPKVTAALGTNPDIREHLVRMLPTNLDYQAATNRLVGAINMLEMQLPDAPPAADKDSPTDQLAGNPAAGAPATTNNSGGMPKSSVNSVDEWLERGRMRRQAQG